MAEFVLPRESFPTDEDKVGLAMALARENDLRGTGLPFGAAVFQRGSGRLVGVGVNLAASHNNSLLHAETVALMAAQAALGTSSLNGSGEGKGHELAASSQPCAIEPHPVPWTQVCHHAASLVKYDSLNSAGLI
ncbi:MAG: hypothetical protein JRJ59_13465 [Deltaproteobacteria bacterium]|nr:hypothetical protein [Deltaproteobacteria bacterium]